MLITQIASKEEQETVIRIEYEAGEIFIFSNKSTIMKKLHALAVKHKIEPIQVEFSNKKIFSLEYMFPISMIGSFLKLTIFKAV